MSVFSEAMIDAVPVLEDMGGELITYTADGVEYPGIMAIAGQSDSPETPTGGLTIVTAKTFDWLIEKSKVPVTEVKRGNMILRANGHKYRVSAPNGGSCWRFSGPSEAYLRIQTIRVQ